MTGPEQRDAGEPARHRVRRPVRVRRAVRQHVLSVLAVMLVVAGVVTWQVDRRATGQAEEAAVGHVRSVALGLALPLTSQDLAEDADWRDRLAAAVDPQLRDGTIVAVHVWERLDASTGRFLWSTSDRTGTRLPLGGAAVALDTDQAVVDRLSDGSESEGPALPNLYEIYLPFADGTGTRYVLEVYKPFVEFDQTRFRLLRDWLPVSLLGVLIVGLVTLPLSLRLTRAVAAAERERTLFADRALRARADEHRRISEVLHERTVQDLSAIRLWLDAARRRPAPPEISATLDRASDLLAHDVHELRELLGGGEGTEWRDDDLAPALAGWLSELPGGAGVRTELPADPLPLHDPAVAVAFRVVKEAVRNAVKHAGADTVTVTVRGKPSGLVAEIGDDGVGIDPQAPAGLGLRLIRHVAADAGGRVRIAARPGGGTLVRLELPRTTAT
ncbi:MAG: ATP-binding protein [Micropruina sp.]|uniref:sensor histidine kinase n=1 Tax=Micropruina sp. TaxID=2737536 RepID=UPI0039E214E7